MGDIVPELLKKIQDDFQSEFNKSKAISGLYAKVRDGTATYKEANDFAIEAGNILATAYTNNLSSDVLPNGKMYYNIAKRILDPTMKYNYDLIADVTDQVQQSLNEAAKIGIKPVTPELNQGRIDGIVNRVVKTEHFDDAAWILREPIVNFSQSIVDDSIKRNAEFHAGAGMKPVIARKLAGGCCEWCARLAGTYTYPDDVPHDVYRRHQRCRCTVDYNPRNGKVQNVHSKKRRTEEENEKIEVRKKVGINSLLGEDVTPRYYGTANPGKGTITHEERFSLAKHPEEIEMANFLHNMFGGEIRLLNEVNIQNVKTADFLWNKKLWDLKTVTTEKAADSAIRKGLKQIKSNPGGVILDYRKRNISLESLLEVVDSRMRRGIEKETDIMIILEEKKVKVYRYKK